MKNLYAKRSGKNEEPAQSKTRQGDSSRKGEIEYAWTKFNRKPKD